MTFEEMIAQMLLMILPDPVVWAILFFIAFGVFIAINRAPASVAGHFAFILVNVVTLYLGGIFIMFNIIMLGAAAVALVLAFLRLGRQQ